MFVCLTFMGSRTVYSIEMKFCTDVKTTEPMVLIKVTNSSIQLS